MNLFQLKEWWRYKRAAKGRHGVHSPFVYRFITKGLRKGKGNLLERCITFLEAESMVPLVITSDAQGWEAAFAASGPLLESGTVIFFPDIHKDAARLAMWQDYCADQRVNLSVEFWQLGLLFHHTDFKEKQHFVLKR